MVASGRGGVGKSSLVGNLGGLAASSGWRVLAVDLDPHASLTVDFGVHDRPDNDHGAALFRAVTGADVSLEPMRSVRTGLDLIPGGCHARELAMAMNTSVGAYALSGLRRAIEPLAPSYDLVVIDAPAPPAHRVIDAALVAARFLVAPSLVDRTALVGLLRTVDMVRTAQRGDNPLLRLLGLAFFAVEADEPYSVAASHRLVVDAADCPLPMFGSVIRSSPRVAEACRSFGLLAHEYELAAVDLGDESGEAAGLAADYRALAREVLGDIREQIELSVTPSLSAWSTGPLVLGAAPAV